ncbi:hypothetical protein [Nocardioides pyridinolyticus]
MTTDTAAVFDAAAVGSLTGHPDDAAFAMVFVTGYRRLLPERVRRIALAVRADDCMDDPADALDAVLSLKVASSTVGTGELGALAALVETHLRAGDCAAAVAAANLLPPAADRADGALGAFLSN